MIGYRFLSDAEQEMSEAAVFYDAASAGLGGDFLDDIRQVIDRLRAHPEVGVEVASDLRRVLLH